MIIQIQNMNNDGSKGSVVYMQEVSEAPGLFEALISRCNDLGTGTSVQVAVASKGRTFVFSADKVDVKAFALTVNGVRTRKSPAKADAPAAPETVEAAPATEAPVAN